MTRHTIILSAAQVRELQAQGRVVVRESIKLPDFRRCTNVPGSYWYFRSKYGIWSDVSNDRLISHYCPFPPGSVLRVRESFMVQLEPSEKYPNGEVEYKADYPDQDGLVFQYEGGGSALRPASVMPAWASRYTVKVESVTVAPDPWTWVVELEKVEK